MGIMVGKWEFSGPYRKATDVDTAPGLYLVLREEHDDINFVAIGIAESSLRKELRQLSSSVSGREQEEYSIFVRYSRQENLRELEQIKRSIAREYF